MAFIGNLEWCARLDCRALYDSGGASRSREGGNEVYNMNEASDDYVYSFELLPVIRMLEYEIGRLEIESALMQVSALRKNLEEEQKEYDD